MVWGGWTISPPVSAAASLAFPAVFVTGVTFIGGLGSHLSGDVIVVVGWLACVCVCVCVRW